MSRHLQHIDPDDGADAATVARAFAGGDDGLYQLCFDALELVRSAAAFFRGVFPIQTAHFWWGEVIDLPWAKEYWSPTADGQTLAPKPITSEVERLAADILSAWDGHAEGGRNEPAWGVSFDSETMTASDAMLMKALAVEVMLSVDGFLARVKQGDQVQAMRWLAAAFKGIIECTLQAQLILGYPSENARIAAKARHRENHDMKRQVFLWLDENFSEGQSMDSAAAAIAGIVVPVKFRTAREWVGQWKRRPPSARTP